MTGCFESCLDKEGESLSKDCGDDVEGNAKVENLEQKKIDNQSRMFEDLMESHKQAALINDLVTESHKHISSSGAFLHGEADRRGELGLSADQIRRFEELGNGMSDNRHQRMNFVRIRRENNAYSPEDRRALAEHTYDEKTKREAKVMADLRKMMAEHGAKDDRV